MVTTGRMNFLTELLSEVVLALFGHVLRMCDGDRDRGWKKKSTELDDRIGQRTTSKLESLCIRGEKGKTVIKKRQKNKVSNYLNLPPPSPPGSPAGSPAARSIQRKKIKLQQDGVRLKREEQIFCPPCEEVIHLKDRLKLYGVAEPELPDDASEVTLPVSLRHRLFGIDFTPRIKYDDVTQPELETWRIAGSSLDVEENVCDNTKPRLSDKYATYQAKALDMSRKELKLRCLRTTMSKSILPTRSGEGTSPSLSLLDEDCRQDGEKNGSVETQQANNNGSAIISSSLSGKEVEEEKRDAAIDDEHDRTRQTHSLMMGMAEVTSIAIEPGSFRL